MKRYLYNFLILFVSIWFVISGCIVNEKTPVNEANTSNPTTSITSAFTALPDVSNTSTPLPIYNFTLTPFQVVIPSKTMSPQESEKALVALLKTNGFCIGKCIAGIRPDSMTFQDAANKLTEWGMTELYENPHNEKAFVRLVQNSLNDQIDVDLSIGTRSKGMTTIDNVFMHISGSQHNLFPGEDVWLENNETWAGIRLDNLLKSYGIPSYSGYFFQTTTGGISKGRNIIYTMVAQYDEMNLIIVIGGLAYYDEKTLFICPAKDPHDLAVEINPEQSLEKYQEYASVTWQELTATDLNEFYRMFTNEVDTCVTTTPWQIQALQPSFR